MSGHDWLLSLTCAYRADGLPRRGQPTLNRIYGRAAVNADTDCWEFQGGLDSDGYGVVRHEGRTVKAHRIAWMLLFGKLADDQKVCHQYDNPRCLNPAHWFLGTVADNNRDRHAKGRTKNLEEGRARRHAALRAVTHCPRGHAYDEANTFYRANGGRECRACSRIEQRQYAAKRRERISA